MRNLFFVIVSESLQLKTFEIDYLRCGQAIDYCNGQNNVYWGSANTYVLVVH